MVTKEIADVKFSTGFFSLKNYTKKMIENSEEVRSFIENGLFEKALNNISMRTRLKSNFGLKALKI